MSFLQYLQESSQFGEPKAPRSKAEEFEIAKASPIYQTNRMNIHGWVIMISIHAAAQAYDRRPGFELDDWKKLHTNIVNKIQKFPSFKPGEYIFFSNSLQQAYVCKVDSDRKTITIITVLPRGRSNPKPGTQKMLVEGVEICILSTVIVD